MKTYLNNKRLKISLFLVTILFVSTILTLVFPRLGEIVLLYPSNLDEPLNWYRLLTYPLFGAGLLDWFYNSLAILLTGYIIENKIKRNELIGLIVLSSIIGGLIFIIINYGAKYNSPIASPIMISWGYWSATIVIGLRNWRTLNLFERIVMILCFLSVLIIWHDNLGFFIGQLSVILTIVLLTILKFGK